MMRKLFYFLCAGFMSFSVVSANPFEIHLRSRQADDEGWVKINTSAEKWNPTETAVIVCDMWDAHHCLNAVRREKQIAPRVDALLKLVRKKGSTIIHAPSSCMEFYKDHAARKNVKSIPKASNVPERIESWCHWKNDNEEQVGYPIDHSDGGEDDDLEEHERWHQQLAAIGRNPKAPWIRQIDTIEIENDDYITDNGIETWSILEHHGIHNVILVGVHTNMCVLGRPFGLRQMANNGKNVVLIRDLTDTMYNPKMPPYVSHFSGTDLIIEHIEQHVCPTISSDQILGGKPHRFRNDKRPHVVMLIGEQEYKTRITLPKFARQHLYRDFRITSVFADDKDRNHFHGMEAIADADLLVVSVRRRTPSVQQMKYIKDYVAAGKPVVGLRTASHAFSLRGKPPEKGHVAWPEFDAEVFGGNYTGHHGNKSDENESTLVWAVDRLISHPLAKGLKISAQDEQETTSWLYKTSPLKPGTQVLMMGRVGKRMPHEPVAWTNIHVGGGRAFYTSMGHPDDFQDLEFTTLLKNSVYWALDIAVPARNSASKTALR